MRAGIDSHWREVLDGDATPRAAARWAQAALEQSPDVPELVLQGLLEVQTWSALAGTPADLAHLRARHESWLAELAAYDADPPGWDRAWFRDLVAGFASRRGADRARTLGLKLVHAGQMTAGDLDLALGTGG